MFEVLEYTLEHQLPNFSECWWDHVSFTFSFYFHLSVSLPVKQSLSCSQWIMDALVCNGLGIYLGMKTLNYLSMKTYHWRGMWNIPSYR